MNFQTSIIAGKVGRDCEMRYTPTGQAVASFSVATNRQYTADGKQVKETTWWRVSVWGKLAEVCNQYVKKGMDVLCEGRMTPDKETGSPRIWTANDGTPRASYELTAMVVQFGGNRHEGSANEVDPGDVLPPDDDMPF